MAEKKLGKTMIELGSVIRAVVVQVSNSTWVTTEQFQAELERHRRELDSSLAAISLQLDNLIDEVEIPSKIQLLIIVRLPV